MPGKPISEIGPDLEIDVGKSDFGSDVWKTNFGNWSRCWSDIPPNVTPPPGWSRPTFDKRQSLTVVSQLARPLPGLPWHGACMSDALRCKRIYTSNINCLHVARTMHHTRSLARPLPGRTWPSSCRVPRRVKPHPEQHVAEYLRRDAVRIDLCKCLETRESTQFDRRDALK